MWKKLFLINVTIEFLSIQKKLKKVKKYRNLPSSLTLQHIYEVIENLKQFSLDGILNFTSETFTFLTKKIHEKQLNQQPSHYSKSF